jgi:nicotinamide riboside kinase
LKNIKKKASSGGLFYCDICSMKRMICVMMLAAIVSSCSNKGYVRARVYERKEVKEDLIMIKYSYNLRGKTITDSATVRNKVMEGDSIKVALKSKKTGTSKPVF